MSILHGEKKTVLVAEDDSDIAGVIIATLNATSSR